MSSLSSDRSNHSLELPILLFDGTCVLCNSTVQFILQNESTSHLKFASLQSDLGQRLFRQHGVSAQLDSMVLVQTDGVHAKSEAAWRVAALLRLPWRGMENLRWIPRFLRDWGYDLVARHRYRWFGTQDACLIPDEQQRARFLDL